MRISQKSLFGALASACLFPCVTGFTSGGPLPSRVGSSNLVLRLTPEEERAALLSDYLARAHEEKLKAIRAIEESKDGEMSALKEQLQHSQVASPLEPAAPASATAPSVGADVGALSKDELVNVVKSYQQFMAKYIVDAQEQKANAVKAAEAAVSQKYEARLEQLAGTALKPVEDVAPEAVAPAPTPEPATPTPIAEVETPPATTANDGNLYAKRNAHIVAAAAAGKSRWGNLEVDRAVFLTDKANTANGADMVEPGQIPPEIEAADHGLRNDGGVGGLTLAERVSMGAEAGSATVNGSADATSDAPLSVPAEISVNEQLFQKRNVRIAAGAKAGKSRWGEMEVMRIQQSVVSVSESKAADIVAADHGLKPDQGVSLADRVNLGARLLGK